jgi:signal transduction histidine kinase
VTPRAPGSDGRPLLSRALNAFGVVLVAVLLAERAGTTPGWAVGASAAGLVAWALLTALPAAGRMRPVLLGVMIVAGSVAAAPTDVVGFVPAIAGLLAVLATPATAPALQVAAPVAAAPLVLAGSLLARSPGGALSGALIALGVTVVVGLSRRQARSAEARERRLLEERVEVAQERARTAALAERTRIARDLHDVLAHSLGGLVLQLDAVDALLEAGRTGEATERVRAAHGLAASGLDEARRAVEALREPETAADLAAALGELVEVHRSLGAAASLVVRGVAAPLRPEAAAALRRAAQELLSNARRHAPGAPTTLELDERDDRVVLLARTPLVPGADAVPGTGRGLPGLRERVRAVGGATDWSVADGAFALRVEVPR